MKIGEFAKKYGINASAIRFYIDKALITPKRVNGLYIFDEKCIEQMDKIMKYKKCRFSLEEIEVLCYYENTTNLTDDAVNEEFLQLFNKKERQICAEIQEREETIKLIHDEVDDYYKKVDENSTIEKMNIPVESLNILACPVCNKMLPLKNADIGESGIIRGNLKCSCGYSTSIQNGMVVCKGSSEGTPFKAFENIDSILAITDDFSPAFRTIIDRAHLWMYQSITSDQQVFKYIMAGPFSYNCMLKHLDALSDDTLYIIVDVSTKKLQKLQRYFAGSGKKILYIAGELGEVPIKKGTVDLYVDDFSSSNYIFTYGKNLFEDISPILKNGGVVTGLFIDYTLAPKSLENFKKEHRRPS